MAKEFIYVKLIKEWGGFAIGDVVRFGANKGQSRIDLGIGVEVPKQRAVNDPAPVKRQPVVETATAPPAAETAVVTPVIENSHQPSAEGAIGAESAIGADSHQPTEKPVKSDESDKSEKKRGQDALDTTNKPVKSDESEKSDESDKKGKSKKAKKQK